jgi:hypothetical protein
MKIYAAGWALQNPALNYFKKFLLLNKIAISGIIYPKKIPDDLDGIPVLDFESAIKVLTPKDKIILTHRPAESNHSLTLDFEIFLNHLDVKIITISDYIYSLINLDIENKLRFPIADVYSKDIRALQNEPMVSIFDESFADIETFRLAKQLYKISKDSAWDELVEYDQNNTVDQVLYSLIKELYDLGMGRRFFILDTPVIFLNSLLKFKELNLTEVLNIELSPSATLELGCRLEFYKRSLSIIQLDDGDDHITYLSSSTNNVIKELKRVGIPSSAIFFMSRSIFDYFEFLKSLQPARHKIILRQPDTNFNNLLALFISPIS